MEVKRRYSKQRECILTALKNTTAHPSANTIYDTVRKDIPNISLGTVYRNLAELSGEGTILKLEAGDGVEHYDGCTLPHYHMYCRKCKGVSDIEIDYFKNLDEEAEKASGAEIESHSVMFFGVCKNCLEK